jgi:hypothetical protein
MSTNAAHHNVLNSTNVTEKNILGNSDLKLVEN